MGAVAQFDYQIWKTRFPEFIGVNSDLATLYFAEATTMWRNDGCGPVTDIPAQLQILNMLAAHIAKLNASSADGSPASDLVGRISSASEGSVSVQSEFSDVTGPTMAWYIQTKYGAQFWTMTASYRTMHYRARRGRNFEPYSRLWPR